MSPVNFFRFIFIIVISGITGYTGNYFFTNYFRNSGATNLSSHHQPLIYGKGLAPIIVQIEKPNLPEKDSHETVLIGYIKLQNSNAENIQYQWTLPNDVQVIDGEVSGIIFSSDIAKIKTVKLQISGFSQEQRKIISLQASATIGDQAVGNSTTISSQPKETWEYYAHDMKKAADEFSGRPVSSMRNIIK